MGKTKAKSKDDDVVMAEEVKVNKKEKERDGKERDQMKEQTNWELLEIVQDTHPEVKCV